MEARHRKKEKRALETTAQQAAPKKRRRKMGESPANEEDPTYPYEEPSDVEEEYVEDEDVEEFEGREREEKEGRELAHTRAFLEHKETTGSAAGPVHRYDHLLSAANVRHLLASTSRQELASTPVWRVVESGDQKAVALVLRAGADINAFHSKALATAIRGHSLPMVRFLLSKGARWIPGRKDQGKEKTALFIALDSPSNAIFDYILEMHDIDNDRHMDVIERTLSDITRSKSRSYYRPNRLAALEEKLEEAIEQRQEEEEDR